MTVTIAHSNPVAIARGVMRVDRKFHVGMLRYADQVDERVVTMNPACRADDVIMDPVEVELQGLPYDVMTMEDRGRIARQSDLARLRDQIGRSTLVYGSDLGVARLCRLLRVPYILILEHDLRTKIAVTTLETSGRMRRLVRSARRTLRHLAQDIPALRAADSVHCNGFPAYESSRRHNANRLLYFDSRMSREMLIGADELHSRVSSRHDRPLRLLYSGRYEPLKGALDVLRVGLECIERGLDIELHCYGQGTMREQMLQLAARRPDRLHVHDPIPYPQLAEVSRSFDLFVCCHVQNDPSCTYLEALGAGLPVLGYANAMWRNMCRVSQAGMSSRLGDPAALAAGVDALRHNRSLLAEMSVQALTFAREHLFEAEFDKRIGAINSLCRTARARTARARYARASAR